MRQKSSTGVDRLDPTHHKYLKVKRVKFNDKKKRILKLWSRNRVFLMCYLYHNFFFSLSILLSQCNNLSFTFPCSSMSTFACVISCSRPPNSKRDITDTQSSYANRKSYITLNCRRAFHNRHRQERKLYKCRNNSIISIAIFHASSVGVRYSLVFTALFQFETKTIDSQN